MSLFERPDFQWRETFFVLFQQANRPTVEQLQNELAALGDRLQFGDFRSDEQGCFESVTIFAPDDFAAMDITCVVGDEVVEQLPELIKELQPNADTVEEKQQLADLAKCNGRLDVFHFEQHSQSFDAEGEEDDFMDPGGLLIVLERLGNVCHGIVVDPQSSSVL